jgi:lactoylglutathione lyase
LPEGVAFMVAPTGERLELLAVDVQASAWDGPIPALRAGVPHTAWTVDDLRRRSRACGGGGRPLGLDTSDTPEPGLRFAFVADPDGNLVELLSRLTTRDARGVGRYGRGSADTALTLPRERTNP